MEKSNFNPLEEIFDKPEAGSPLEQDFEAMKTGSLHNSNLFDEEGDAHGGEKINPATGKANKDKELKEFSDLSEIEVKDSKDIMGDIKDPSKMSLEELISSQKDN